MKPIRLVKILLLFLGLASCKKDSINNYPDIKIGKEDISLETIAINKQTERKIVLSGGNNKFTANIENSKLAQVSIHQDTLIVKGLFEGETFATIFSHNKKAHLKIKIVAPPISISHDSIRLFPQEESKFISLTGGGDIVNLDINDPDSILITKWNAQTNILEIRALYEGNATITANSAGVTSKVLQVEVRSGGSLDKVGYYNSSSRTLSYLAPKLIVRRKGVGTWITNGTNPYGSSEIFSHRSVVRISEIPHPKVGESVEVTIKSLPFDDSFPVHTGTYRLLIEDVREKSIVIRGKGFKFVLPK